MIKPVVAVAFLALNAYVYHFFATDKVMPPRQSFESFPLEMASWGCGEREYMEPKVLRNLGVTDYLICTYASEEQPVPVGVYVGYHATQVREEGGGSRENAIHAPKHCLPGAGWDIIDFRQVELDLDGLPQNPARVNRLIIAKGEARQLVYYWYQSRGRVIADDWKKIVYMTWDRARLQRTDGSLVRFTVPIPRGDLETAERTFRDFAPRVTSRLARYVPE